MVEKSVAEKAGLLISTFTKGLAAGVKHYRKSDGALLTTVVEIIEALRDEREIEIIFPPGEEPE